MHTFHPSALERTRCAICKRPEIDHGKQATCEVCGKVGQCELFVDILMCNESNGELSCFEKEQIAVKESAKNADKRVEESKARQIENMTLEIAKAIDNSIQVNADYFNAKTVSIAELEKLIAQDENIKPEQRSFELAKQVMTRCNHLKQVCFDLNKGVAAANTELKSSHIYLNQLASKLRQEEREKLRLQDITYKPVEPKKPVTKATVKRLDIADLKKWAAHAKVPEAVIQILCISKNMTPEAAAIHYLETKNKASK